MSDEEALPGAGDASPPASLEFEWEKVSPARIRVKVRHGERLVFAHSFDINNATSARERFAAGLAARLGSEGGTRVDPRGIEAELLRIIDEAGQADAGDARAEPQYLLVEDDPDPRKNGIYEVTADGPRPLCNFTMRVDKDVVHDDGGETRRRFEGRITLDGRASAFAMSPDDFANPRQFMAAVYAAAGPRAQFLAKPEAVCRAVSALSEPASEAVTNGFGWDQDGEVFRGPFGRIDASGVHPAGDDDPVRVDLSGEDCARHLDLAVADPNELRDLKVHVVGDLLGLADRLVTSLLLAATALAPLIRFVPGMNRPALWLVGLTGSGKSFLGRLFANFSGDFPVADGARLASWTSTGNALQRMGWFFKDAVFFVDDFKPELARHADYVKVMQNYADGSTRGRLRADATSSVVRQIRGILVSTGEDVPEHSASALARNVVVAMPSSPKDTARGARCLGRCGRYRAVQAAFIHHLISRGRTAGFSARVEEYRRRYLEGIEGRQNDVRIAGNLALFAAAFGEYAGFLGDAWPGWEGEVAAFAREFVGLRDEMVAAVRDQQASEIFLDVLRTLVAYDGVRIRGLGPEPGAGGDRRPLIGRIVSLEAGPRAIEVATRLAFQAVQEQLRRSGKPPLPATEKALIGQLAADGKLLDRDGSPLVPKAGRATRGAKIDGQSRNAFLIASSVLIDEAARPPRGPKVRSLLPPSPAAPPEPDEDDDASAPEVGEGRR